jgi:hypothetical protein
LVLIISITDQKLREIEIEKLKVSSFEAAFEQNPGRLLILAEYPDKKIKLIILNVWISLI